MAAAARHVGGSPVEEQALELVRELLAELGSHRAAQTVSLHSSFDRDLGLGSLERVELLLRCERRFNKRLPDEVAQRAEAPAEWVRALLDGNVVETKKARYLIQQPPRQAPRAPDSATTWAEVLRYHTELDLGRAHIHLLDDLELDRGQDITYGALLEGAASVAAGLIASGLRQDDTVAIMLSSCADFFYAFFGVMLAGGIAVPIYPPVRPDKIEEYVYRQVHILRNAEVRFLITFDRVKAVSQMMRVSLPSLAGVMTVKTLRQCGARLPAAKPEPASAFFIQYTSGSTGDPKGVVLTHSNVLANVRGIGGAVKVRPCDTVVTWLPLYHDMGLIGSWLFSLYYGLPITILSPLAFLSRPERWLWALHDSKGTLCPAPNFSYELCARKIPDEALQGLDLSAWRVAINAGEAVLPETLARFEQRFAPYGFRAESFVPCYGLAESSVALTFPPLNRRPVIDVIRREPFEREGKAIPAVPLDQTDSSVLRFVANGRPMPHHEVRIVDEQGGEVGERVQGLLLFRGLSKTPGYYRNPEATRAAVSPDGWMDSGDLAYWADGELYITGRSKDLIIKAGRNIIPQEVEAAAAEVAGVRKGCVAAFGSVEAESGTERLVVVAETRATTLEEVRRIESEVAKNIDALLGIPPDTIVLVPPQTIPKTSSGKIRRKETCSLYQSGDLRPTRRPAWLQVVRLGCQNLGSWIRAGVAHLGARLRTLWARGVELVIGTSGGLLVRLAPNRQAAFGIARWAAQILFRLVGQQVTIHGRETINHGQAAVLIANRAGSYDPLLLISSLPCPFLIADRTALSPLPREIRFLLEPLVVAPLSSTTAHAGGTLRQRIHHALRQGHSVLVFPESPVGAPPQLSRFRMDAFHAAAAQAAPIQAIATRQNAIYLGEAFRAEHPPQEVARLREQIRKEIARLVG